MWHCIVNIRPMKKYYNTSFAQNYQISGHNDYVLLQQHTVYTRTYPRANSANIEADCRIRRRPLRRGTNTTGTKTTGTKTTGRLTSGMHKMETNCTSMHVTCKVVCFGFRKKFWYKKNKKQKIKHNLNNISGIYGIPLFFWFYSGS